MDYHPDWLHMALYLAGNPELSWPIRNHELFQANQEDTDLLVAFDDGAATHLVLLEAKLETGWTNAQLGSKAARLKHIFGDDGRGHRTVQPHFVLLSPQPPQQLDTGKWPPWMTTPQGPRWIELPRPPGLKQVYRSDEHRRQDRDGRYLSIRERGSGEAFPS